MNQINWRKLEQSVLKNELRADHIMANTYFPVHQNFKTSLNQLLNTSLKLKDGRQLKLESFSLDVMVARIAQMHYKISQANYLILHHETYESSSYDQSLSAGAAFMFPPAWLVLPIDAFNQINETKMSALISEVIDCAQYNHCYGYKLKRLYRSKVKSNEIQEEHC